MTFLVPILLTAALGANDPFARLEPHDGALWYTHTILSTGGERGIDLELASSSDLPFSGLFGRGIGITEETFITVLPGGALRVTDPGPCPACSVVVAEPSPDVLAASVTAAAATLEASGVSTLAGQAAGYATRLRDDVAFRESEWRRQNDAWLAAARAETSGGVMRLPVAAHFRAVALPGGFVRYSGPHEIQEFDANGRLMQIVSVGGVVVEIARDQQGRIQRISDAAGRSVSFQLDEAGRAVRATSTRGLEIRLGYDPLGRLARLDGPRDRLTFAWNADDQLTEVTGEETHIRATYLARSEGGRLASLSTGNDSTERYSYQRHADGLVQVTEVHDEWMDDSRPVPIDQSEPYMRTDAPPARRYTYVEPLGSDGRRFVWQQVVEDGGVERVTIYDQRTFQPVLISAGDSTAEIRYDDFGRIVERRRDDGVTEVAYAPSGKVSRLLRRYASQDAPDASQFEATYKYDDRGDLTEASDSEGRHVVIAYDARRQISEIVVASRDEDAPRRLLVTRNDEGRPVRLEVQGIGSVDVSYGPDGEIAKVDSSGKGVALAVIGTFGVLLDVVRAANLRAEL